MSDRASWLEEWCPDCHAASGARCRLFRHSTRRADLAAHLHKARGWRQRPRPRCKAQPGELCRTPSRRAAAPHTPRLSPARYELGWWASVWAELERRRTTIAVVPFHGKAGAGSEQSRCLGCKTASLSTSTVRYGVTSSRTPSRRRCGAATGASPASPPSTAPWSGRRTIAASSSQARGAGHDSTR